MRFPIGFRTGFRVRDRDLENKVRSGSGSGFSGSGFGKKSGTRPVKVILYLTRRIPTRPIRFKTSSKFKFLDLRPGCGYRASFGSLITIENVKVLVSCFTWAGLGPGFTIQAQNIKV